jgi:hypothetical protein
MCSATRLHHHLLAGAVEFARANGEQAIGLSGFPRVLMRLDRRQAGR